MIFRALFCTLERFVLFDMSWRNGMDIKCKFYPDNGGFHELLYLNSQSTIVCVFYQPRATKTLTICDQVLSAAMVVGD